ncbi:MAG TPA: DUF4412 domain-containing protein [Gemmatimonadaceae bacterium]|nr:DUF4412 domain-containing protein [Gemmatimonadaceae bacterium]
MRHLIQIAAASTLSFCLFAPSLRAQGDDVAFDFRQTETRKTPGKTTTTETTGHAVMSKGRMRMDMTGSGAPAQIPGFGPGSTFTMILPDNGRTFILLSAEKKQYMQVNPSAMMEGMQKMMEGMGQKMAMEISGDDPKVENLGKGPDVMGHHTAHWRMTTNTQVRFGIMGQNQEMGLANVSDMFIATDMKNLPNPFRGLQRNPIVDMFGDAAKDYMAKTEAATKKLPEGAPLRIESHGKMRNARAETDVSSVMEVTAIRKINAKDEMFAIPAGYTQMQMPMMPGVGKTR